MHRLQVNFLGGLEQKMEQQTLNNIVGKRELQKKGFFTIAPVNRLIPNSFNHIFLTVCFGKILNFYIRIMAHGYCFSNRAFIFFPPGSTFFCLP